MIKILHGCPFEGWPNRTQPSKPFLPKRVGWPCPVSSAFKRTPLQDSNFFSIMFYYINSTTNQKIGDLYCLVIFLDFRTVCKYMLYQPSGTWRLLPSPKIVYSCASKGLITRLQNYLGGAISPTFLAIFCQANQAGRSQKGHKARPRLPTATQWRRHGNGAAAGIIAAHCLSLSPSGFGLAWRGMAPARTTGQNKSLQAKASAKAFKIVTRQALKNAIYCQRKSYLLLQSRNLLKSQ